MVLGHWSLNFGTDNLSLEYCSLWELMLRLFYLKSHDSMVVVAGNVGQFLGISTLYMAVLCFMAIRESEGYISRIPSKSIIHS